MHGMKFKKIFCIVILLRSAGETFYMSVPNKREAETHGGTVWRGM